MTGRLTTEASEDRRWECRWGAAPLPGVSRTSREEYVNWALAIAERTGPRKAKVARVRKLAVILHAMWRTDTPFRDATTA
jgi:hypothetical protein